MNELSPVEMDVPSNVSVQVYADSPEMPIRMEVVGCPFVLSQEGAAWACEDHEVDIVPVCDGNGRTQGIGVEGGVTAI